MANYNHRITRPQVIDSQRSRRAFSLVEVVLALGVFAFCIPVLVALLPIGLNTSRFSREKAVAYDYCSSIESDLRAASPTATASPLYGVPLTSSSTQPTFLYDSTLASSSTSPFSKMQDSTSQYRFTIFLTFPTSSHPDDPIIANIIVTWPPLIDPTQITPAAEVSTCVAMNRVGS